MIGSYDEEIKKIWLKYHEEDLAEIDYDDLQSWKHDEKAMVQADRERDRDRDRDRESEK